MYYPPAKFGDDMPSGFLSYIADTHAHMRTQRINAQLSRLRRRE